MVETVLVILIGLWLLGYISIPGLPVKDHVLFVLNDKSITVWDALILCVALWLLHLIPRPFRDIGGVLLIIYALSTLGYIAIEGLSNVVVISLIAAAGLYLIKRNDL